MNVNPIQKLLIPLFSVFHRSSKQLRTGAGWLVHPEYGDIAKHIPSNTMFLYHNVKKNHYIITTIHIR